MSVLTLKNAKKELNDCLEYMANSNNSNSSVMSAWAIVITRTRPATEWEERKLNYEEIYMADNYACEKCADMYFNSKDLGFCADPYMSWAAFHGVWCDRCRAEIPMGFCCPHGVHGDEENNR